MTIRTPSLPTKNPVSGNEIDGPPTEEFKVPARLSQDPVANVSQQMEMLATQRTTISMWTVLVQASTLLTSRSEIEDEYGRVFRVEGAVANRPEKNPKFKAAAARLISDMQA